MINTGIRAHKNQLAREFIRSQLVLLEPGEALPSLRCLVAASGLGRIMLENAIAEAIAAGMLEAKARVGCFRTVNIPGNEAPYGIVVNNRTGQLDAVGSLHVPSFTHKTVTALCEAGVARGASMRVLRLKEKASAFDYAREIQREKLTRVFIVSPGSADFLRCLLGLGIHLVSVSGTSCPEVPFVNPPREELMDQAMEYLFARNHQLIGHIFCDSQRHTHFDLPMLNEYYRKMAERGYRVWPHFLAAYPNEERLVGSLTKMFEQKPRPTAVICPSVWLPTLYAFLSSRSLLVGRNISVVATGQESEMLPRPTLFTNIPEALAEKAWQMMDEQLRGDCVPYTAHISTNLVPGKSVVTLSS